MFFKVGCRRETCLFFVVSVKFGIFCKEVRE